MYYLIDNTLRECSAAERSARDRQYVAVLTPAEWAESSRSFDMGIDLEIRGTVTVPCDRCLEDLEIPVEEERKLSVKFGNEPTSPLDTEEGERETVYFSTEEPVIDLRQIVYDYTCLAVPMQRVHKEGECNPAAVAHLSSESDVVKPKETATDNPFAALKDLLAKKQDS